MKTTNWDTYYKNFNFFSYFTRKYTLSVIIGILKNLIIKSNSNNNFLEIGGANSCFLYKIMKTFNFIEYCIIDNNKYGLLLSRNKFKNYNNIVFLDHDVTQKVKSDLKYGFVLSIGVIEHFQDEILQKVIHNHCSFVERGGYLILSYPTPTIIYKSMRKILEISNNWLFFDEVPLLYNDISQFIPNNFTIIKRQTLWFNLLTQELLILKKNVS